MFEWILFEYMHMKTAQNADDDRRELRQVQFVQAQFNKLTSQVTLLISTLNSTSHTLNPEP